jgi:hypothetical protein
MPDARDLVPTHVQETSSSLAWRSPREALRLIFAGRTLPAAAQIAGIVGLLLVVINQGGAYTSGNVDATTAGRTALNFAVPFFVASCGMLAPHRVPRDR